MLPEVIVKILGKDISNVANKILWLSFLLALFASVHHIAFAFGELEFDARLGWLPAIAIDGGLAAMAYGIQQNKKARRKTQPLWIGVVIFSTISAVANYLHAVAVDSSVEPWQAVIFSASLPLLVVFLGEIVSNDDVQLERVAEKERRKVERKEARVEIIKPEPVQTISNNGKQTATKEANKRKLAEILASRPQVDDSDLAGMLEVSPRTIRTYKAELSANGKGQ